MVASTAQRIRKQREPSPFWLDKKNSNGYKTWGGRVKGGSKNNLWVENQDKFIE